jgi:hypothetical protein
MKKNIISPFLSEQQSSKMELPKGKTALSVCKLFLQFFYGNIPVKENNQFIWYRKWIMEMSFLSHSAKK